jgi:hypothetical protein
MFFLLDLFLATSISTFLSLLLTLILGVYFPEKVGIVFFRLLDKPFGKKRGFESLYSKFVKKLRLKIWVYIIAFSLTLISSLELISGNTIIHIQKWIEIKPYILQAVVAFLAFDRLIKAFVSESKSISKDLNHFFSIFKETFRDEKVD